METGEVSESFWGDKLYQQRARKALPCLVRQASMGETIFYSDLAEELEMPNARNLNYVLGCIGSTLNDLSKEVDEEIPAIQCLVVNKTTKLPGKGIGFFIYGEGFGKLTQKQKKERVDSHLSQIYTYSKWPWVLDKLKLDYPEYPELPKPDPNNKGGGESPSHKALKEYIANNPSAIGLSESWPKGEMEFSLPSGDFVDVMFSWRKQVVAVEVKSKISGEADIYRGLFQCVKYQAVTEAMLGIQGEPQNVRTLLVLESELPKKLISIKNMLGVEVLAKMSAKKS